MANPRPKVLVTESEYRKAEVCFLSAAGLECNTARGSLIDEDALFAALAERRLAGAAVDVFGREPYAPMEGSGDLRSLANVILTPHVSSNTVEANRRMAERALQNIVFAEAHAFARMDLLNPEVLR